jgi:hypothetical protein
LRRNKGENPAAFSYENDISRCSAVKLLIDGALETKAAANIKTLRQELKHTAVQIFSPFYS